MNTSIRRPVRSSEQTSQLNSLYFSRKLLFVAALLHLVIFAIPLAHRGRFGGVLAFCIAVCAVAGYVIAAKNADSGRDYSEDSVAGPNLQALLKVLLYIWLIVPIFNLPVIVFAYFRATGAIRALTGK
jgi:hypothetical protein